MAAICNEAAKRIANILSMQISDVRQSRPRPASFSSLSLSPSVVGRTMGKQCDHILNAADLERTDGRTGGWQYFFDAASS